jgi:hypothetical protein
MKNVLIFPAGAENALEIYDALRYNVNVHVYGASGKKDFAEYEYSEADYIEGDFYIFSSEFKAKFKEMLIEYKIDIIIPTHDDVTLYFAENKDYFGVKILVSDIRTCKICREKKLMYELLSDLEFCPKTYDDIRAANKGEFPLFVKPNIGAGAVGAMRVDTVDDFDRWNEYGKYVITEYLPGEELTVDCFTNRRKELTFAGARSRDRIQMGIAFRSTAVEMTDEIFRMAKILNERLDFFGAWYFQIKKDKFGKFKLLEVSCRQSGGMTLYRHLGINFPMLGIFELLEKDTDYVLNTAECQMERRLFTKFKYHCDYNKVYIDLDDTIIVENRVCMVIICFLYQCVNQNKELILLTRHEGSLKEIWNRFKLSENLFDKIYHMEFEVPKTDFIQPNKAIFIDNSYKERRLVYDKFQIPVFDIDMIDMLIEN